MLTLGTKHFGKKEGLPAGLVQSNSHMGPQKIHITIHFLWDMNHTNGFYIQFRQSFAKETFSYDEYLKS